MMPCIGQGISFDFSYTYLLHSNLGGQGPDRNAPHTIRYVNVGAASVPLPGGGAFTFRFDLEVTALSAYVPYNASLNGLNGRFAQINLAANEEVELRATVKRSCSEADSCTLCEDPLLLVGLLVRRRDGDEPGSLHGVAPGGLRRVVRLQRGE